jgi:hypothetical protein
MTDQEIDTLMTECGLIPVTLLRWTKSPTGKTPDQFLPEDDFIDGDYASLKQFAKELLNRQRKEIMDALATDAQVLADNGCHQESDAIINAISAMSEMK